MFHSDSAKPFFQILTDYSHLYKLYICFQTNYERKEQSYHINIR